MKAEAAATEANRGDKDELSRRLGANSNTFLNCQSLIEEPLMVSGIGQHHTNEIGREYRKPYLTIDRQRIQSLVDYPQKCEKPQTQWLIPSTVLSRTFKTQEQQGSFWMLWGDLDDHPPTLHDLAEQVETIIGGSDYETYNSRSATVENQKARLLISLSEPLSGADWMLVQEILNDKLEALGIKPDRATERAAQLCYLPNKGAFYGSLSKRDGQSFNPLKTWAQEIAAKRGKLETAILMLEEMKRAAMVKKAALTLSDSPNLIAAFNLAYTPQEILSQSGYSQRGNTFRHPNSESGSYSASLKPDDSGVLRVNALSPNDPLYSDEQGAHDAFSCFTVLNHGSDRDAALKDAGDNLLTIDGSVSFNKAVQREHMQKQTAQQQQRNPARDQTAFTDDIDCSTMPDYVDKSPTGYFSEDIDLVNIAHDYPQFNGQFYGIAGEVAKLACENSEADEVAVYFSFLTAAAALFGDGSYFQVGDTKHHARLFSALVGASSRARKGTSFKPVERIIRKTEELYFKTYGGNLSGILDERLVIANGGLSSAEGLIYAVRDESQETKGKDEIPLWSAVNDKRLLVVEEELASVLKVAQREGNNLSPVLRKAWDGGTLAPMTKNNRLCATNPHINTIGHITQFELKALLTSADIYSGLVNRFLWACVRRTKKLSNPEPMDGSKVLNIAIRLSVALHKSEFTDREVSLSPPARKLWDEQYLIVSTDRLGVLGAVTARNEAHVLRVALTLCLLDGSSVISPDHISAAIDVVDYSTASCEFIFTTPSDESTDAQKLLSALEFRPMSQTEINRLFNSHKTRRELFQLLTDLQSLNKIRKRETSGSKKIIWEKIITTPA